MPRHDAGRSGQARARSARAGAGYRGLLRRVDENDGRGERELHVRRVVARRRGSPVQPVDGLYGGPAVHHVEGRHAVVRRQGYGVTKLPVREHGAAPVRLRTGLDRDNRVRTRGSAIATANPGVQPARRMRLHYCHTAAPRKPHAGVDDRWQPRRLAARKPLVASGPDRGGCQAGSARAASQSARRTEHARRAPQGHPRGTQPARTRHPRQPRTGIWRDPDAAPGNTTRRSVAVPEGVRHYRNGGGTRSHAPHRGAPIGRRVASQCGQR